MKYCPTDYMLIENYDKALADDFKGWICHHINGEILSREELVEMGLYYDVPYYVLKFVTLSEHIAIHGYAVAGSFKGHHHTEETKKKIGAASKGNKYAAGIEPWNKGLRTSAKWSHKPKWTLTDETKKKHSEAMKKAWAKRRGEITND